MTRTQRERLEAIVSGKPFAPVPMVEDVRICLAEIARLHVALAHASKVASDAAFGVAVPAKRPRV